MHDEPEAPTPATRPERVNIVYVGGTVDLLLPCLDSILEFTDWPLRLVANGCSRDEREAIDAVRDRVGDRVEVRVESIERVLSHGAVLDRLVDIEESPYFCFVDSDILATGPTDFWSLVPDDNGVSFCSCLPIWQDRASATIPESFDIIGGEYVSTDRGDELGCTYAATYHTADLRRIMSDWSLSFRAMQWDDVPLRTQKLLERHGQPRLVYDTGKVINLVLALEGRRSVVYRPTPSLLHIGSMSTRPFTPVNRLGHLAKMRAPVVYQAWARLVRGLGADEAKRIARAHKRKHEASDFYKALIEGSASAASAPAWLKAQPETLDHLIGFAAAGRDRADRAEATGVAARRT